MKRPVKPGSDTVDLTVVAVPGYFAAMGVEYWLQRRRLTGGGPPTAGDFEARDTSASLSMGVLSLLFVLIPFLPIVRDIPRWIPIHRLIWREHYRDAAEAGPSE